MPTEIIAMDSPETRLSLIGRLQDHEDEEAWREFVQLYQPMIFRIARRRGLQHADAAEVTQEVLGRVAAAVDRWRPDPGNGSFRGWLFRITRNLTIDWLRRDNRRPANLDSATALAAVPEAAPEDESEFETEYRRSVFSLAASRIKGDFQTRTWQAFWRTAVEGVEIKQVAQELDLSVGAVYIARSRVMKKLSAEVRKRTQDTVIW
jgi:RNA polymerase sigma-70 factor (ECF subfamily)